MTCGSWMVGRLLSLEEAGAQAMSGILEAVHAMPRRVGSGDAFDSLAKVYGRKDQAFLGEVACLEALRFTSTLIAREGRFDSLVNLVRFELDLKSFDEAWEYGVLAEQIRSDDTDLAADMVCAAAFTGREQEALARFERLSRAAPIKARVVQSMVKGELAGTYRSTRDEDCSGILERLRARSGAGQPPADALLLAMLQARPEGRSARACWWELCRHGARLADQALANDDEADAVAGHATVVAAAGKALNADADGSVEDGQLWRWRGQALARLRLFEMAIPALERVQEGSEADPELRSTLERCRRMTELRQAAREKPELLRHEGRRILRTTGNFWEAFELFQEHLFVAQGLAVDPQIDPAAARAALQRRATMANALHQRGYDLFSADADRAAALLCQAAAANPDNPHTWQELGSLYASRNCFHEGEQFQAYAVALARAEGYPPKELGRFLANLAFAKRNRARQGTTLTSNRCASKLREAMEVASEAAALGDGRAANAVGRWRREGDAEDVLPGMEGPVMEGPQRRVPGSARASSPWRSLLWALSLAWLAWWALGRNGRQCGVAAAGPPPDHARSCAGP